MLLRLGRVLVPEVGMLLRRRSCSGPLVLLGVAVCLFYQTLMVARNRLRSGPPADVHSKASDEVLLDGTGRLVSALENLHRHTEEAGQWAGHRRQAVVLTGQHAASDTEVQLYQQVLEQKGYEVHLSQYAETSRILKTRNAGGWSLLLCLRSSEQSCRRRVSASHLRSRHMVNMVAALTEAFSDAGDGRCHVIKHAAVKLPVSPHACGSSSEHLQTATGSPEASSPSTGQATPPHSVAMVTVYVLVTSATPLTAFLHDVSVVSTNRDTKRRSVQLMSFLLQTFGPSVSHVALGRVKKVIGEVLQAAVLTNQEAHRCVLCFQLLTLTLHLSETLTPIILKVDTDVMFSSLSDDVFVQRISREMVLEDALNFLLPMESGQYGGCRGTFDVCLSEDELMMLLQFHRQIATPTNFQLLFPCSSCSAGSDPGSGLSGLLFRLSQYYEQKRNHSSRYDHMDVLTNQNSSLTSSLHAAGRGSCVTPHLRQIYTDPPLSLTPSFSPFVKTYYTEVTFDTVMVRIRPEPINSACYVHLDDHNGPRMAHYPIGLGNSRISILVMDEVSPEPVAMTIYTLYVYRESRPSLPMFGDHVMCRFVQDCGLLVQLDRPCGLQLVPVSQNPREICSSGDVPGLWEVPCLTCADNRTCDWREVAWQPEGCHYPVLDGPQLQDCMTDRKLLFIGDSTNRGMMYFLVERVNLSLEDWGKAHDTLTYNHLNAGRTHVSYSYYPQFWLEKKRRPTFRQALEQLLHRSRPLVNSNLTVLVVGGVQWLNTNHLTIIRDLLERETLTNILVVVKSLGMGFHLPGEDVRSLSLKEIQQLYHDNHNIISAAKHLGYEVIDTFSITMGRYKEFLQGRCACHFHEVEKLRSSKAPPLRKTKNLHQSARNTESKITRSRPSLSSQSMALDTDQWAGSYSSSYHVTGPVNQVYSEILLSRLCSAHR
ncbi:cadherin-like and PC-esterase domain-containing protein 1 [Thalassophryne amazonica]|uniref:cadherin-like and PC-esterase domain-containing protein 1 n=1 Tax=Thalassophryne amazonica TaxID=390379 RepID=UPI001471BF05|nr:cadherin-like and PC-esterase domain-containing protein 1 [Thalassophryne amazonica]